MAGKKSSDHSERCTEKLGVKLTRTDMRRLEDIAYRLSQRDGTPIMDRCEVVRMCIAAMWQHVDQHQRYEAR